MPRDLAILMLEALCAYFLVLWTHSLRRKVGLGPFYALLGGITVVMSWVTDAEVQVHVGEVTYWVGSTVFYTSLLLGVFVVYVFDGPHPTRVAILTVLGVSAMAPVIALVIRFQTNIGSAAVAAIPEPSLRTNVASLITTLADLLFLAMAWEWFGKRRFGAPLGVRALMTLLGVMWLDVLLFNTLAFAGTPGYLGIMSGTFISRVAVPLFAFPMLYLYLSWQNRQVGVSIENRPVLTIMKEVAEVRTELGHAREEIELRKRVEKEKEALISELEAALKHVRRLEGLLPVCASCGRIRTDSEEEGKEEAWVPLEDYLRAATDVEFSHGLCADCVRTNYPDIADDVINEVRRQHRQKPREEGGAC